MNLQTAKQLQKIAADLGHLARPPFDGPDAAADEMIPLRNIANELACIGMEAEKESYYAGFAAVPAAMGETPMLRAAKPGPIHTRPARVVQNFEEIARTISQWNSASILQAARLRDTIKQAATQHRADCRTLETTLENLDAASPAAEDVPDDYDTETPVNPAAVAIEEYLCDQGAWNICEEAAAFSCLHTALREIADHAAAALVAIRDIRAAQDKRLILTQRHG